jgi:MoxR-like ATPase
LLSFSSLRNIHDSLKNKVLKLSKDDKELKLKTQSSDAAIAKKIYHVYGKLKQELSKIIIGQDDIIEQLVIALLANGHSLLVGVPGLAKTLLIKTIGEILSLKFSRIQFTPDLMPSDIIGSEILQEDKSTGQKIFTFIKGPVFANLILADEINRTPPKTQSALLEAMQEHKVTAAGHTHVLEEPFFVLATQNPIEQEGTYPLPEAQLDRFMFHLNLSYPTFEDEVEIVKRTTIAEQPNVEALISKEEILLFQNLVKKVPVADRIVELAVQIVQATRSTENADEQLKEWIRWGAGPRASQHLILAAKVRALLHQRYSPDEDDIRTLALPVLRHRLIASYSAQAHGVDIEAIIGYILNQF